MPSLEALAEHPGIVFGAYIAALLPLAVIYALDFISEKWRPIRETRRKGYFYLFSSIIPLGFVMFYIHLQKVAKDYKEMAAAVSAAIFCIVHIMRTIWGLVQLRAFKAWNMRALYCLNLAGYECPLYRSAYRYSFGAGSSSYFGDPYHFLRSARGWIRYVYNKLNRTQVNEFHHILHSEREIEAAVDNAMVVNSGLLDNEFMGANLPCRPNIKSMLSAGWGSLTTRSTFSLLDHLESVNPVECSVQWMVAFLSKFGGTWLANHHLSTKVSDIVVERELELGLRALLLTTYVDSECGLRSVLHPASEFAQCADLLLRYVYRVPELSSLPFNMRGLNESIVYFESFESSVRNGIVSWDNKSLHDLNPEEREAVRNISPYDLSRFAVLMDVVLESKGRSYPFREEIISNASKESSCFKTFFWQIDCTSQRSTEQLLKLVSVAFERYGKPLWKGWYRNELLLEASVHVDNWKSLECGSNTDDVQVEHNPLSFECARRKEVLRHRMTLASGGSMQGKTVFLGCIIESVRALLAVWSRRIAETGEPVVNTREDLWTPEIGKTSAKFKCSDQLRESLHVFRVGEDPHIYVLPLPVRFGDEVTSLQSAKMRLLWELQTRLHENIASEVECFELKENLPQSEELIILFLLGFPALDIKPVPDENSRGTHLGVAETRGETEINIVPVDSVEGDIEQSAYMGLEISPVQGPQDISVRVVLDCTDGHGEVRLIASTQDEGEKRFEWQQWKDSVMGRLAGQSEFRLSREISKEENLRSESFNSDISAPFEKVSNDLSLWQGWPPFLCHISIVDESGCLHPNRQVSPDTLSEKMNTRTMQYGDPEHGTDAEEKNSVEDILLEAKQARKERRFEKSIELYNESVVDHKCSRVFHELETMIRDDLSQEDAEMLQSELFLLLRSIFFKINMVHNNEAGNEESVQTLDVSFGMLARCFGLLHEKTGAVGFFRHELECMLEHDNEQCIRIMETFLAKGGTPTLGMVSIMFLAHFRNFAHTGNATHLSLLQNSAEWYSSIGYNPFMLTYAFLLEKGRICGRDFHRLNHARILLLDMRNVTRYFAASRESWNGTVERKVQRTAEVPVSLRKAANIYEKIFDSYVWNSHIAMNRYGLLHMIYPGELLDVEKAKEFLQRAVDYNNVEALCNLAVLQFHFHSDRATAMELLEIAVSGDPFGDRESQQPSEAGESCSRSSMHGDTAQSASSSAHEGSKRAESSRNLDLSSRSVTSDRSEPLNSIFETVFVNGRELKVWYRSDISQNPHTTSMNNMAVLLEEEEAGHNGVEKALRLYRRAREIDGNPIALYNMAVLLITAPAAYRDVLKGNELLKELTSRVADIGHMQVLMSGVESLERYEGERGVSEWTVEIEELDDSAAFVKHVQADGDEELAYDE